MVGKRLIESDRSPMAADLSEMAQIDLNRCFDLTHISRALPQMLN